MKAKDALRSMLEYEGVSAAAVASAMGKSSKYLHPILYAGRIPQADNYAAICDALDYDLLARSRKDGQEFVIDPPESG